MTPTRLREIRESMALTQEGLAVLLGRDRVTITRWETGTRAIPPEVPLALAAINAGLPPME
jgi:transcriptional regulator with XRE-family HTH domain